MFEDYGIADVRRHGVGSQDLQRQQGVFHHGHGIASIEAGSDVIPTGFFNDSAGFGCRQVAVVLDSDFDVGTLKLGFHGAEGLDDVVHHLFHRATCAAVVDTSHDAAHRLRTDRFGDLEAFQHFFFRGLTPGLPAFGDRANAANAGIEFNIQLCRMVLHLREVGGFDAGIIH